MPNPWKTEPNGPTDLSKVAKWEINDVNETRERWKREKEEEEKNNKKISFKGKNKKFSKTHLPNLPKIFLLSLIFSSLLMIPLIFYLFLKSKIEFILVMMRYEKR